MTDPPVYVYCLRDRKTGEVGYVGSGTNVESRAASHFAERLWGRSAKAEWIRQVWAKGSPPEVVILEEVTEDTRLEAENKWLELFRNEGHPITNRPGKVRQHRAIDWDHCRICGKKVTASNGVVILRPVRPYGLCFDCAKPKPPE